MADKIDHVEIKGVTYDVPGADGTVSSVNGQTGTVVLDADDVGALPDDTSIPSKTSDLTNDSGFITSASVPTKTSDLTNDSGFITSSSVPTKTSDLTNDSGFITTETDPTVPSWAKASTKPTYTAQEVGALPSSTSIPSKTSDLTNDSGYITSAQAPVTSVNGMTGDVTVVSGVTSVNGQSGAVVLDADDVGALPDDTSIPSATSDLQNDSGFVSSQQTEKIFVQGTTPSTASDGDIWIDTATQSASGIAYLPLSAGDQHPLSDDLVVEGDGDGCVRVFCSDSFGYSGIYAKDSSDVALGGVAVNNNDNPNISTIIYGDGRSIFIRPNGLGEETARSTFYPNGDFRIQGQLLGGNTVYTGTGTLPHNYSGSEVNVPTTILDIQNLPSGQYHVYGQLSQTFTDGSVSGQAYISVYQNGTALAQDLSMFTSRPTWVRTIATYFNGSGRLTLALDSNKACTVRGYFYAIRFG